MEVEKKIKVKKRVLPSEETGVNKGRHAGLPVHAEYIVRGGLIFRVKTYSRDFENEFEEFYV